MNIYKELFKAAPCDQCRNYEKCADKMMACPDFIIYVSYGEIINANRSPSAQIYNRIYGDDEPIKENMVPPESAGAENRVGVNLDSQLWRSSGADEEYREPNHPGVTSILNNLAVLSDSRGMYADIEAFSL